MLVMAWIQTFTGKAFDPLSDDPGLIDIRDIAHALSMQCRFNGHCRAFYSVAQHSVHVSQVTPAPLALWGLLHDAAEAYLSDLPRPVKSQFPLFSQWEDRLLGRILQEYGLTMPMPDAVRQADERLLMTEARDLMAPPPKDWRIPAKPLENLTIHPLMPAAAEKLFLQRYAELTA
jgi:hypothetical protein